MQLMTKHQRADKLSFRAWSHVMLPALRSLSLPVTWGLL